MTIDRADVVVIGAGLGGLSAAAYLAKAGHKVVVLEHHTVPGGYAHEFRRGRFRFEVALHAMDGVTEGGWVHPVLRDLGVLDRVPFTRLDPLYRVQFPNHLVTAHADLDAYTAELGRHFPHESANIDHLVAAMKRVGDDVARYSHAREQGERIPMEDMPAQFPDMTAAMTQPWGEFMGQYLHDVELKAVFSTLWGYFGLPPSTLSAGLFTLGWLSYHLHGGYYPEGGSQAISRAIERTIKEHGGTVLYRQRVTGIELRDGAAVAVNTNRGLRIETDFVVSNASPRDTFLNCIDREQLPADYVEKLNQDVAALSNLVVYMGLTRDLAAEGWTHHEFFSCQTYDIDEDFRATCAAEFDRAGMVIAHYTESDPTCAPKGCSVLVAMCLAPWDFANQWGTGGNLQGYGKNPDYLAAKNAAGEALIRRVERHIPNLRESIKYLEVATPLTNYRYSLNPAGSIYGGQQTVDNVFINRLSPRTPIPNLVLTGAWVAGGGMSTALVSGRTAAQIAGKKLGRGVTV